MSSWFAGPEEKEVNRVLDLATSELLLAPDSSLNANVVDLIDSRSSDTLDYVVSKLLKLCRHKNPTRILLALGVVDDLLVRGRNPTRFRNRYCTSREHMRTLEELCRGSRGKILKKRATSLLTTIVDLVDSKLYPEPRAVQVRLKVFFKTTDRKDASKQAQFDKLVQDVQLVEKRISKAKSPLPVKQRDFFAQCVPRIEELVAAAVDGELEGFDVDDPSDARYKAVDTYISLNEQLISLLTGGDTGNSGEEEKNDEEDDNRDSGGDADLLGLGDADDDVQDV